MPLLSLRCNRDFTSASSYRLCWLRGFHLIFCSDKLTPLEIWPKGYAPGSPCVLLWSSTSQYYPWPPGSLKFVPNGPINNIPSLVQIMAWRRPGDKPLSAPMMVSLTTHICVNRPQWVDILQWQVDTSRNITQRICARLPVCSVVVQYKPVLPMAFRITEVCS